MKVQDLKRGQLRELKVHYLDDLLMEKENRNISYGEICDIDDIITDEEVFEEYNDIFFVEDDFCTIEEEGED